jgi:hypothetical protein
MSQTSLKLSALIDYQSRIEQSKKDTDGFTVVGKQRYNRHKSYFEPSNSNKTELTLGKTELTSGKTELTSGKTELTSGKTELTSGKVSLFQGQDHYKQKQDNYSVFSPNTTNVEFEQSKRFAGLSSLKKIQDDRKKAYEEKKTLSSSKNFGLLYSLKKEQDQKYADRVEARSHMYVRLQETDNKLIVKPQLQEPINIEDEHSFPSLEIQQVQPQNQVKSWSQKIIIKDEKEQVKPLIVKPSEIKSIDKSMIVEISIVSDKSIVYDDLLNASKLVETPSNQDIDDDFTVVKSLKHKKVYY